MLKACPSLVSELMTRSPWYQLGRLALVCPSLGWAEGRRQEPQLLLGSAFICVEPRDFCEDSWPLAGDTSSFRSLDWCGLRSVSGHLAETTPQGQGRTGEEGGFEK